MWGERGLGDGKLLKPRAIAIDQKNRLYVVDWSARIQVFDRDGNYLGPTWTTPDYTNGRPSGLSIDPDGNLIVSDSHYSCLRIYSPKGKLLRTIHPETKSTEDQTGYICDAIQDEDGYLYVAEFGDIQRITKLDRDGSIVQSWGDSGNAPGHFARIRAMVFGPDDNLYVADAANHRIQVFSKEGELIRYWGSSGNEPGQLSYPYDLDFTTGENPVLYVLEFGNNRVQKFTPEGKSLGIWGGAGREPGKLFSPWGLAVDRYGSVHVLDSENHRVQRIRF